MSTPTVSLCMIVRDEEEMLPRCLASVKDFVDEIVVVDTGSSDRTVEIAQGFGARVYRHPGRITSADIAISPSGMQGATGSCI